MKEAGNWNRLNAEGGAKSKEHSAKGKEQRSEDGRPMAWACNPISSLEF